MRRIAEITIEADAPGTPDAKKNRDAGKTFLLTEWDAETGEAWANRAIIAIGNSGAEIEYVRGMGFAGIAALGMQALFGIKEEPAIKLVNELMDCVKIKEALAPGGARALTKFDIEEINTRWRLKQEVFALHGNFSIPELMSTLISATARAVLSLMQTSLVPLDNASPPDSQPKPNSEAPSESATFTN